MTVKATIWTHGKMVHRRLPSGKIHNFWEKKCVWEGEIDLMPVNNLKGTNMNFSVINKWSYSSEDEEE